MKILHLGKYFPPHAGGMETYLRDLMAELSRTGIETAALVHQSHISLNSSTECYRADEQALDITRAAVWVRLLFTPFSPGFPWQLHRLIKQKRPDVLHLHMPNVSAFWALLVPGARRLPWVIQWQSDVLASRYSTGLRLFYRLYRPFERLLLKRSRAIIASSPPYLESSLPLQQFREKCHVIPLGLDPEFIAPAETPSKQKDSSTLRVLGIGRFTYYKGFEYLLRAAAETDRVEVHLVGDGELRGPLQKLAITLGIADRVCFHGRLNEEELSEQYTACDCVCLPSIERTEAFGLVLLEAMYFGRATVISDVPGSGMGWIVEDGVTGLKVPPANAEALASAFRQLRSDRDILSRLGRNGRKKFERQFHIRKSVADIVEIYTRLAAEHLTTS
jgi:glycosyltransferase involved in cell wall biosynthesis